MVSVQTLSAINLYTSANNEKINLYLLMALFSSYLLRNHFGKVILYSDNISADILRDSFYTEIRTFETNKLSQHNCYENCYKLISYANTEEEYVHVDIDYFMFKNEVINLENNIICAWFDSKDKVGESAYNNCYINSTKLLHTNNLFTNYKISDDGFSLNKSLFAVSKELHNDVTNHYKKFVKEVIDNIDKLVKLSTNFQSVIEQYLPCQYFIENKYNVLAVKDRDKKLIFGHDNGKWQLHDYDGLNINGPIFDGWNKKYLPIVKEYIDNNSSYHMLLSKETNGILNALEDIVETFYPEVFEKYKLVVKNKNKKLKNIKSLF
jgi:hypothetical protein